MRIKLDIEDVAFATTSIHHLGDMRWMTVRVGERQFCVRREIKGTAALYFDGEKYIRQVDELLIREMEVMLGRVFVDACEAVPQGTELVAYHK